MPSSSTAPAGTFSSRSTGGGLVLSPGLILRCHLYIPAGARRARVADGPIMCPGAVSLRDRRRLSTPESYMLRRNGLLSSGPQALRPQGDHLNRPIDAGQLARTRVARGNLRISGVQMRRLRWDQIGGLRPFHTSACTQRSAQSPSAAVDGLAARGSSRGRGCGRVGHGGHDAHRRRISCNRC